MKKLTKKSNIGEAIKTNKNAAAILSGFGMHCFGCPMAQMETLEQAAKGHKIDLKLLLEKLNETK